jgi:hypothetical protein
MSPDRAARSAGSARIPYPNTLRQFRQVMHRTGRGSPASGGSEGSRSAPFACAAIRLARGFARAARSAGHRGSGRAHRRPEGLPEVPEVQEARSWAPFWHFLHFRQVMHRTVRGSPADGGSTGRRAIALLRRLAAALDGLDIGRTAQCASLIAPYASGDDRCSEGMMWWAKPRSCVPTQPSLVRTLRFARPTNGAP